MKSDPLRHLKDPIRSYDLALKLQKLPGDSQAWELYRKLLEELNAELPPRGVHQTQIIHHISSFLPPQNVWRNIRPVCSSWKSAIDSMPKQTKHLDFSSLNKEPIGYLQMFENVSIIMGQSRTDKYLKKIVKIFHNMKYIAIGLKTYDEFMIQSDDRFNQCLLKLLQNSRTTLTNFSIQCLELPIQLPKLQFAHFAIHTHDTLEKLQQIISRLDFSKMETVSFDFCMQEFASHETFQFLGNQANTIVGCSHYLNFVKLPFIDLVEPNEISANDVFVEYIECDVDIILFPDVFGSAQALLERFPSVKGICLTTEIFYDREMEIEELATVLKDTNIQILSQEEIEKLKETYLDSGCRIELR